MPLLPRHWVPQPLTALVLTACAIAALSWAAGQAELSALGPNYLATAFVDLFLLLGLVLAIFYPIHVDRQTKLQLSTLPLFLMAVLLPPLLAGLTAGVGTLLAQTVTRHRTHNLPSDIATAASRLTLVVLVTSAVARLGVAGGIPHVVTLAT